MIAGYAEWYENARCRQLEDPEVFFGGPEELPRRKRNHLMVAARGVCQACPVRGDCLRSALRFEQEHGVQPGVWGGLGDRERERILQGHAEMPV